MGPSRLLAVSLLLDSCAELTQWEVDASLDRVAYFDVSVCQGSAVTFDAVLARDFAAKAASAKLKGNVAVELTEVEVGKNRVLLASKWLAEVRAGLGSTKILARVCHGAAVDFGAAFGLRAGSPVKGVEPAAEGLNTADGSARHDTGSTDSSTRHRRGSADGGTRHRLESAHSAVGDNLVSAKGTVDDKLSDCFAGDQVDGSAGGTAKRQSLWSHFANDFDARDSSVNRTSHDETVVGESHERAASKTDATDAHRAAHFDVPVVGVTEASVYLHVASDINKRSEAALRNSVKLNTDFAVHV